MDKSAEERRTMLEKGMALEFSHTLETQIGGQIKAGFIITGFYEDHDGETTCSRYMSTYIATRSDKIGDI